MELTALSAAQSDPLIAVSVVVVAAAVVVYEFFKEDPPDPTTLEGLNELYSRDEVSDAVYNRRHDVLLREDEGFGTFSWFQEIDGVGPETAFRLADQFETMSDVREADQTDFEDVHNVGESIAGAIEEKRSDEQPIYED
jgi:hypothetical protein